MPTPEQIEQLVQELDRLADDQYRQWCDEVRSKADRQAIIARMQGEEVAYRHAAELLRALAR